jgi:hypothetical protein
LRFIITDYLSFNLFWSVISELEGDTSPSLRSLLILYIGEFEKNSEAAIFLSSLEDHASI